MSPMIDREALIDLLSKASSRQGETVRTMVRDATLRALQGRALTLQNIRKVLQQVTEAASAGAMSNVAKPQDVAGLLEKTVAGIDDALLKAVEANRIALERFVEQGVDLQNSQLKKALDDLDKLENAMIGAVRKSAGAAGAQIEALWAPVLRQMQAGGTNTGTSAAATLEEVMGKVHGAIRDSRASSLRAANALAESYAALVGGVLLGMSEAFKSAASAPAAGTRGDAGRK